MKYVVSWVWIKGMCLVCDRRGTTDERHRVRDDCEYYREEGRDQFCMEKNCPFVRGLKRVKTAGKKTAMEEDA